MQLVISLHYVCKMIQLLLATRHLQVYEMCHSLSSVASPPPLGTAHYSPAALATFLLKTLHCTLILLKSTVDEFYFSVARTLFPSVLLSCFTTTDAAGYDKAFLAPSRG